MSIILFETVTVLRKSITELQITAVTNEILERSEKKYRHLIETMNHGFWMIDENRITTRVNNKTSEMLGYSPVEMIGKDAMSPQHMRSSLLKKMGPSCQWSYQLPLFLKRMEDLKEVLLF
jgi:PAS domain-containing protein